MKTVSFHSHKGGAGKTTLGLCLAKLWAGEGVRTCIVDLDFVGSGIEGAIVLDRAPRTLVNDILVYDVDPDLATLVGTYVDDVIQDPPLGVILNAGRPWIVDQEVAQQREIAPQEAPDAALEPTNAAEPEAGNRVPRTANREDSVTAQSLSGIDGPLVDALQRMLVDLADAGYERCVLDCHPGLFEISLGVFAAKFVDARVLVSTTDVSHFWGTIEEINGDLLTKGEHFAHGIRQSVFVVNRADRDRFPDFGSLCDEAEDDPRIGVVLATVRNHLPFQHHVVVHEAERLRFHAIVRRRGGLLPALIGAEYEGLLAMRRSVENLLEE